MTQRPSLFRAHHAGLFTLALLAGCASGPHHGKAPTDTPQQVTQGKGYLSEEQHSLRTTPVSWLGTVQTGGRNFDLIISSPVRPGRYPLIVYLPGLGEPRTAGDGWRNAWAQAGYVVASIQLLAEDGQAWQSPAARHGDFRPLVRERFAASAMEARQQALHNLLEVMKQHAGDPTLANADFDHIVLAGYDLGAYTALVGAGEKFRTGPDTPPIPGLAGVIALSPYADFSGPGFESRYGAIRVPVLSVTGPGDTDLYGAVSSVSARTAPFQHMPPGGKYLLSLDDVSHEQLSGSPLRQESPGDGERNTQDKNSEGNRSDRGNRRNRGGGGMGRESGGSGDYGDMSGRNGGGRNLGNGQVQPIITAITTAFLDALIRQDDIAQEWLRRDARRWLREAGSLTVR